jgi:hypothetical protein
VQLEEIIATLAFAKGIECTSTRPLAGHMGLVQMKMRMGRERSHEHSLPHRRSESKKRGLASGLGGTLIDSFFSRTEMGY